MSEKREWVLKAFRGEAVDRVPVGFWHHFTSEEEWLKGFSNPVIIEKNIQAHKQFIRELNPDFIKLMSDGYFAYPNPVIAKEKSLHELAEIEPLGKNHPWIREQVELVKKIKQSLRKILLLFTIFLRLLPTSNGYLEKCLVEMISLQIS